MIDSLTTEDLFAELDRVAHLPLDERAAPIWRALTQAASSDDIQVALDYLADRHVLSSDYIGQLRGDPGENRSWTNPIDGSEMIWIDPGPFYVGHKNERTACEGFFLARHPVTKAQFNQFIEATGYFYAPEHSDGESFLSDWDDLAVSANRGNHPVVWVSFVDALHYCRWAGMNLATEWLWEKAARGSDGRRFPRGDDPPFRSPNPLAHVHEEDTSPIGRYSKTRNPYGCEDLVGNVSEWCRPSDEYSQLPATWPADAELTSPPQNNHPVRGSAFMRSTPRLMASEHRRQLSPFRRNQWVGFRPAFFPLRPT